MAFIKIERYFEHSLNTKLSITFNSETKNTNYF